MNRVSAMRAQFTRQAHLRWARFWRWYRTANRRTQVAVGVSALIGVLVLSSLAIAAFNAGAHPSGNTGQAGLGPTATHGSAPHMTHRPSATGHRHGHGRHNPHAEDS